MNQVVIVVCQIFMHRLSWTALSTRKMISVYIGLKMASEISASTLRMYQILVWISLATPTKRTMGEARCTYDGTVNMVCFQEHTTMRNLMVKTNFFKIQTDCIEILSYLGPLRYGTIWHPNFQNQVPMMLLLDYSSLMKLMTCSLLEVILEQLQQF